MKRAAAWVVGLAAGAAVVVGVVVDGQTALLLGGLWVLHVGARALGVRS